MKLLWSSWAALSVAAFAAVLSLPGCSTPPETVTYRQTLTGWEVTAKWDSTQITVSGLENALSDAMDKLTAAQNANEPDHAAAWQAIIDRILDLKNEAVESEEEPGAAAIARGTQEETEAAYQAYEDGFTDDVDEASEAGVSDDDLEEVKTALLGT
jgi:hypothetical protein